MSNYDLLQTGARVKRFISSCVVALVTCGVFAPILWKIIDPPSGLTTGPWKAFMTFLALVGAVAFMVTNSILRRRDDRQWSVPAQARARETSEDPEK